MAAFVHRSRSSILSDDLPLTEGESTQIFNENVVSGAGVVETQGRKEYPCYDHEQDLERRLAQFKELENEYSKRYGTFPCSNNSR